MKSKFNIFIVILFIVVVLISWSSLENVIKGGDSSGYYSSIEDFRNAYPLVGSTTHKYVYTDSTVIATIKDDSNCYDFVIKNDEVAIIKIDYKDSLSGEKFKYGGEIRWFPIDSGIIEVYKERYTEGYRSVETLFEEMTFSFEKNQLWICILSSDCTLEIPGVEKYEFSYNNEPYILHIKLIPAK